MQALSPVNNFIRSITTPRGIASHAKTFAVISVIAFYYRSRLFIPCFAIASSSVATHLALKFYSQYNRPRVIEIQTKALDLVEGYKTILRVSVIVAFVFAVVLSKYSVWGSGSIAAVHGACGTLIVETTQFKHALRVRDNSEKQGSKNMVAEMARS